MTISITTESGKTAAVVASFPFSAIIPVHLGGTWQGRSYIVPIYILYRSYILI